MKQEDELTRSSSDIKFRRRRAIKLSEESLIKTSSVKHMPLIIEPNLGDLNLVVWAEENREFINEELLKYGALLFRNFRIESSSQFEKFVEATSNGPLKYMERSSPRSQVSGNIYTSTDHPPDQTIFLHNEQSYNISFPMKIYFFCATAAPVGGETPIADTRRILQRIDPAIRERLIQRQYMYVRNFGSGFGLSWQDAFQTSDKRAVEEYCLRHGIAVEWKGKNQLKTHQVRRVVAKHPGSGEMAWFNHATFFHISTIDQTVREKMLAELGEDGLPNNTCYGNGQPVEPEVMEHLRNAYLEEKVLFQWQSGDVLMLDNMLASHGREAFQGERKVLVGMADQIMWDNV